MSALLRLDRTPEPPAVVVERIRAGGRALVALSGGVDSGVVAWFAARALGGEATAVTLTGAAVSPTEHRAAAEVAGFLGLSFVEIEADPIARAEYRANPKDRCYYCREVESAALREYGREHAVRQYLDGLHLDDLGEDRPGIRAMNEAGFTHPLIEAGWTKFDVRAFAQEIGLPNWDRPSNACLASRVEHGLPISPKLLARIDAAEQYVRTEGFRQVRVRVGARGGRVEVGPDEVARLFEPVRATRIVERLKSDGWEEVVLDPRGYHADTRA
jgi:pyridinium-3,5-biscarboxylic acid mononucleotide sulfurtransferase